MPEVMSMMVVTANSFRSVLVLCLSSLGYHAAMLYFISALQYHCALAHCDVALR